MASISRIVAKGCKFQSRDAVIHRPRYDLPARGIQNHVWAVCLSRDGKSYLAIQSKRFSPVVLQSLDSRYLGFIL
ncbi:hypothetical protein L1987_30620 [Smallanthus sonchifolius]|uniref:Uncharacterized protein n=1 Tax=Smallanthus sonchifolius TaxID=185202 RepID=A0ACB9I4H4_9ASTR|nr:hypothetical protein L1987_30620 [Smallanthus sonchifolius]